MQEIAGSLRLLQPRHDLVFSQHQRHTVMDFPHGFVGLRGQNAVTRLTVPDGIQSCHIESIFSRQIEPVLSFLCVPLIKARRRDHTAL